MPAQVNPTQKSAPQPKVYLNQRSLQDLAKSGITPETALVEKVFSGTSRVVREILGWPAGPGTVFQFGEGFYHVKLYRKQKDGKQYRQPKDTVNQIYIPRYMPDRDRVLADPSTPLYVTEGEKKAIKMCQEGLHAVATTGVEAWLRDGQPIPGLDRINWQGRAVTIVFDSDPSARSKGNVERGRRRLADELRSRGADPDAVILPDDGKAKVGVDDYLVAHSVDEFLTLPRVDVPIFTPITNRSGGKEKSYVTTGIEKLIWFELLKKISSDFEGVPEFDVPFRTALNSGMKSEHLTSRVRSKNGGDPRVKVGKESFAYVIVYYNLRRRALHPKGKQKMTTPRGKDIPVWQGLMELEAGELTLPITNPTCPRVPHKRLWMHWARGSRRHWYAAASIQGAPACSIPRC